MMRKFGNELNNSVDRISRDCNEQLITVHEEENVNMYIYNKRKLEEDIGKIISELVTDKACDEIRIKDVENFLRKYYRRYS